MPEMCDMVRPTSVLLPLLTDDDDEVTDTVDEEDAPPLVGFLLALLDRFGDDGAYTATSLPPPLADDVPPPPTDLLREAAEARAASESSTRSDGKSSSCCLSAEEKKRKENIFYIVTLFQCPPLTDCQQQRSSHAFLMRAGLPHNLPSSALPCLSLGFRTRNFSFGDPGHQRGIVFLFYNSRSQGYVIVFSCMFLLIKFSVQIVLLVLCALLTTHAPLTR